VKRPVEMKRKGQPGEGYINLGLFAGGLSIHCGSQNRIRETF
jgi:hypothetical protein